MNARFRTRLSRLGAVGLLVAATGVLAGASLAVVPGDGGTFVTLEARTINAGVGDQFDPHVSGDLVSYTDGDTVRYYDFATLADQQVPLPPNTIDQLSDVSDGRIVFTRFELVPGGARFVIVLHDVALGTATEVGLESSSNPAIGSTTVAFSDGFPTELFVTDSGGLPTRLTDDTRIDQHSSVASSGNLVVWESCEVSSANCDIRQAARSGSSWVVTPLTTNSEPEASPGTDGTVVTYDANRSGERDIYWQPVGGGPEQRLELAGEQRFPTVSNGIVLFESVAVGEAAADLWLYRIATNSLFRVTSTPGLDENLNDISVLADGRVRAVWSSGVDGNRNVFGATITLPPPPPPGPSYTFGGFLPPIDPQPTINSMKAGAAAPVKFSLGGDFGLAIFAADYPKSQSVPCDSSAPVDGVETTLTAGGSSLSYDATSNTYKYVWKTEKSWAGTCRQLVLKFADGSTQRASFKFK